METKQNGHDINMTPDAHIKSKKNFPMMQTTDLSLKMDPKYGPISRNFHKIQKNLQMHLQELGLNLLIVIWVLELYLRSRSSKRRINLARSNSKKAKYKIKNKDIKVLKTKILKSGLIYFSISINSLGISIYF